MQGSAFKNAYIDSTSKVEAGGQIVDVKMNRHSFIGYDCKIINCQIGAFCSIADRVIIGGAQHPMEWVTTSPAFQKGRNSISKKYSEFPCSPSKMTIIGNDVWIGDGVFIKAGVHVGDGAVIGMGSIVTKDVDAYAIVAGNPAKLIRKRFDDDICEALLKMKWWEFNDEQLKKYAQYIRNPEKFIEVART